MKRIRTFLLLAVILLMTATSASAIQLQTNGDSWFLPDGRIVQTKKVFTGNGSEHPGLLCYGQNGELLWEHTFRTPAIGRSFCRLIDDHTIAFMYYDQNHQFFVEYFDRDGTLIAKNTQELSTTAGALYEGGAVFCVKHPHKMLSIRHWDGREKRWEFQDAERMTLYSVKSYANKVYIELSMENASKKVHSILCIDEKEDTMLWEYRLDEPFPVKAYTGNEQDGITLFVQKDDPNGRYELEMITLDSNGAEIIRTKVNGLPATMAMNVISEQENGIYTIWGYGYDTYGENKVICAKLNTRGEVEERTDIPTDYATCVRYLNNEVYVMDYQNGLELFELIPFAEFTGE